MYLLLSVLLVAVSDGFTQTYDNIIQDQDITSMLYLENQSNVLIRNCDIHNTGTGQDGIFLRGVSNVRITKCRIYDIDGKAGIRSSIYASSDHILIDSNTIYNIQNDGIMIPQRSQDDPPTTNTDIRIIGNHIYDTGLYETPAYPTHAVYCQAPDFLIEGNLISGTRYGNGLSVRSSGVVRGNVISGSSSSDRSPIRYFSDHFTGPSDTLLIENNMVINDGTTANAIDIYDYAPLYANSSGNAHVVKNHIIRFNTAISVYDGSYAIAIPDYYNDPLFGIRVEGNLAVNTRNAAYIYKGPDAVILNGNYTATSLVDFTDTVPPYDFHLTGNHGAIDYAAGVSGFPEMDIDGDLRVRGSLDAGADQTMFTAIRPGRIMTAAQPEPYHFPGPCCGSLTIYPRGGLKEAEFRIFNARGRLIAAWVPAEKRSLTVDLSGYAPGLYLFDGGRDIGSGTFLVW